MIAPLTFTPNELLTIAVLMHEQGKAVGLCDVDVDFNACPERRCVAAREVLAP